LTPTESESFVLRTPHLNTFTQDQKTLCKGYSTTDMVKINPSVRALKIAARASGLNDSDFAGMDKAELLGIVKRKSGSAKKNKKPLFFVDLSKLMFWLDFETEDMSEDDAMYTLRLTRRSVSTPDYNKWLEEVSKADYLAALAAAEGKGDDDNMLDFQTIAEHRETASCGLGLVKKVTCTDFKIENDDGKPRSDPEKEYFKPIDLDTVISYVDEFSMYDAKTKTRKTFQVSDGELTIGELAAAIGEFETAVRVQTHDIIDYRGELITVNTDGDLVLTYGS